MCGAGNGTKPIRVRLWRRAGIFFFLPSSVSIVWLVTLMVSLGQAVWHKPQATQWCSFFSLWGIVLSLIHILLLFAIFV